MRVLCSCVPGFGHLHPLLPVAGALRDAGHEVAFATEQRFCARAERAGFAAFPAGLGTGKVLERALALPDAADPADHWRFGAQLFGAVAGPAKVPDLLGVVDAWRPDLLVSDVTDLAGPLAAAIAGVPAVAHGLGPPFPAEFTRLAAELVAPAWRDHGLDPPPLAGAYGELYLDLCPPSLQPPDPVGAGVRVQPLRPVPADAVAGDPSPLWLDGAPPARPFVYVTLGTIDNDAEGVLEAVVAGLGGEPVEVVVTVGPGRDPAGLGRPPANVRVEAYVPQSLLYPRCDAVVTHGGSGTVLGALAHGVPLLVLPQGANQFRNADRVAALGAGLRLLPGGVTAAAVRAAVRSLLAEPGPRAAAGRVAAEIAAMPPPEAVVEVLEGLVADR